MLFNVICSKLQFYFTVAADVGDTGAEFDRVFLQELRDLKVFVNDREIVEEHRRFIQKYIFFKIKLQVISLVIHKKSKTYI